MTAAFQALADPTRRTLLDRLRSETRPMSLSDLADGLPITRQAVTKHLDALRDAGLVRVWTSGRERLHQLEPAPLREVTDWLAPYAAAWDARLARLQAHLQEDAR